MKVCPRTDTVATEWVPMSDPHHRDLCVNCGATEPEHVEDGRPTAAQLAERRKAIVGVNDFLAEFPGDDPDSFMAKHFVVIPVTIPQRKDPQ